MAPQRHHKFVPSAWGPTRGVHGERQLSIVKARPPMSHAEFPLDSTPITVREARAATRSWLGNVGRSSAEHPASLVVSELVTNSAVHARGPIVLHLWDDVDSVRIGVSD